MASAANIVHSTARRTATMMIMTMRRPLPLLTPPPPAASISSPLLDMPVVPVECGRGDKRTKKGKRFKGSYGNARPKKEKMIERLKDKLEVPRSTPWPLPFKIM